MLPSKYTLNQTSFKHTCCFPCGPGLHHPHCWVSWGSTVASWAAHSYMLTRGLLLNYRSCSFLAQNHPVLWIKSTDLQASSTGGPWPSRCPHCPGLVLSLTLPATLASALFLPCQACLHLRALHLLSPDLPCSPPDVSMAPSVPSFRSLSK